MTFLIATQAFLLGVVTGLLIGKQIAAAAFRNIKRDIIKETPKQ